MILMQSTTKEWESLGEWSPDAVRLMVDHMNKLNDELKSSGELVDAQGLGGPQHAKIVRAGAGGGPVVTDGPFPEAKEFLAGFWIVDVATPERAIEIAARASACPGPDGKPGDGPVEVHPVMDGPPVD
ncbi:MAG TPA: YciI family protein [Actinophytocola sp.]|uniref:YciI family protein n=1 Tax=Actinophytocola sp. TaxID=1872138 RepID=UPI002DDD0626|nr:YciI family protein [Actinophytocola sp.]HEV2784454.1 YciI family protein [Actinophytocola sp.]